MRALPLSLVLLLASGCPEPDIRLDAGGELVDAGDAAAMDAGDVDAGDVDAGVRDAGPVDAGPIEANIVFVTSEQVVPGMLGNRGEADAICNRLASDAGLPDVGSYVAYLSQQGGPAMDRLAGARGWVRPDGEPFAATTADIAMGRIWSSPVLDERGDRRVRPVVTASGAMGSPIDSACDTWTSLAANVRIGISSDGTRRWLTAGERPCSDPLSFYCFGTARSVAVSAREPAGRIAFRSRERLNGGSGVDGFDALCQREADMAGFGDRTFVALVSTSTEAAAERLRGDGAPWYRPDGVLVARSVSDIASATLHAPVTPSADLGGYVDTNIWAGSTTPGLRSTRGQSCDDWTSGTMGRGVRGSSGWATDFFQTVTDADCESPHMVLCFEP